MAIVDIPAEVKKRWKKLYKHGDMASIVQQHPEFTRMSVSRAIKGEQCSLELLEAINKFYNDKEASIAKAIGQTTEEKKE